MNALSKVSRVQRQQQQLLWKNWYCNSLSKRFMSTGYNGQQQSSLNMSSLSSVTAPGQQQVQQHGIMHNVQTPTTATSTSTTTTTTMATQQSVSTTGEETICPNLPLVFDTHKLVSFLNKGGFSLNQSEAITNAMVRISQESARHHSEQMVTKSEFSSLRSELSILEKADFALLKTDINSIEKRLETSVAEIYTNVERVENRVIKWTVAVAGAIGLAILRLMSTSGSDSSRSTSLPRPPTNVVSVDSMSLTSIRPKYEHQIVNT